MELLRKMSFGEAAFKLSTRDVSRPNPIRILSESRQKKTKYWLYPALTLHNLMWDGVDTSLCTNAAPNQRCPAPERLDVVFRDVV